MRRIVAGFVLCGAIALLSSSERLAGQSEAAKEVPKYEWPKEIAGKNLEAWVKDMKDHPDPSMRELAVRTVPLFGPDVRKVASANLLHALTRDKDYSVRMTALGVVPTIGFEERDTKAGIAAMIEFTRSTQFSTRHDATVTLGNCGWVAKDAIPTIVDFGLKDVNSWQIRRVSAIALAQIGAGLHEDGGPDTRAITGLIERLPIEPAVQVRREIVQALLVLGIPSDKATWVAMRRALETHKKDSDKSTAIWTRICLMRSEDKKITEKDPNLKELIGFLKSTDPGVRTETLQALGQMGSEISFVIPELKAVVDTDRDIPTAGTAIWALTTMTSHAPEVIEYLNTVKKAHTVEAIRKTADEAIKYMTQPKKDEPKKDPKKDAVPKKEMTPKKNP